MTWESFPVSCPLFSRLKKLSFLSLLSLTGKVLQPPTILVTLHWTCFSEKLIFPVMKPKSWCTIPAMVTEVLRQGQKSFPLNLLTTILLMRLKMLLAFFLSRARCCHAQPAVCHNTQALFSRALRYQTVLLPRALPTQLQDFTLTLADFHWISVAPFLQLVCVPMASLSSTILTVGPWL